MRMSSPRISVIITAYNRKEYLDKAIESVIRQDMDHSMFEVILVTNFEFNLGHYLSDVSISSIVMDGTIGEFLYAGIKLAKFDLIAFLDDDDEWENKKLSQVLSVFRSNVNVDYYHNKVTYINETGESISYYRMVANRFTPSRNDILIFDSMNKMGSIPVALKMNGDFNLSCIIVRKAALNKYLEILQDITGNTDGFFFWSSIIYGGKILIDNKKLTKYRVHEMNVSKNLGFKGRESEVSKQIKTYSLLLDYLQKHSDLLPNPHITEKWISFMKLEYEMIQNIFLQKERKKMLEKAKTLLSFGHNYKNTLKYRLLFFSGIYLISPKISIYIYAKISR